MYRKICLGITLFIIMNLVLLNVSPARATSADLNSDKDVMAENAFSNEEAIKAIEEKIQSDENIRLIVGVKNGFQEPSEITNTKTIDKVQQDVISKLMIESKVTNEDIKIFKTIPFLGVKVNEEGFKNLLNNPNVVSIEEDIAVPVTMAESNRIIGSENAWDIGYTGKGQTVAVLDTGVDKNHPFLTGKVVSEACYSTTNSYAGATTLCPDGQQKTTAAGSAMNCHKNYAGCEHGTHVAGTVAGKELTFNGKKISGVAKDSKIIAIQVFSRFLDQYGDYEVRSYTSDQILALERVLSLKGLYNIASVNMSLGGGAYSNFCDSEQSARKIIFDKLTDSGIAVVVASGNDYIKSAISAPACISSAIGVGATTDFDTVAEFSNSAETLDLLAPGVSITSSVPGSSYDTFQGTSMATPHVAGAWAILKEKNPNASVQEILEFLQVTGKPVNEYMGNVTKSRIDLSRISEFGPQREESLEVNLEAETIDAGNKVKIKTWFTGSDNKKIDVTTHTEYSITDSDGKVSKDITYHSGYINVSSKAIKGMYTLNAIYKGVLTETTLEVKPVVSKLIVEPSRNITLTRGKNSLLILTAVFTDESREIVTADSYTSSNLQRVLVDKNGLITIPNRSTPGPASVTIKYGNYVETILVTVETEMTGMELNQQAILLEIGKTAQFKLSASYSDGKNKDITRTADYQVVNANGTSVSEITIINGTLKASKTVKKGSYTLIASYQDQKVQSTVVVSPVLTKITADPDRLIMNPGESKELNVIAEYSDNSSGNITEKVTYKSSNTKRAEIDEKGVITIPETASSGTVTITAKYGSRSDTVSVTVEPEMTGMKLDQQAIPLEIGKTARFQLKASYSDGKNKDITRTADYQVVNANGTSVSEITISNGTLKASKTVQKGSYTLIASYQDKQEQSTIEVSPVLTKITADFDRLIMNPGKSKELNVIAEYSDNSSDKVTDKVTYKSSNTKRAEIDEKGVITIPATASSGTVTITAKYGSRSDTVSVTVEPEMTGMKLDQQAIPLEIGKTARFQLMASYSDGKNKDITRTADYQVVDANGTPTSEITISNGTLKASKTVQKGRYTLIASYQDKQAQSTIEVSPVLTKIAADFDRLIMNPGKSKELNVIAEYSDNSGENITEKVTYKSSNTKRAEVDEKGVITIPETASSGTVTITAKYGSRSDTVSVTVEPEMTGMKLDQQAIPLEIGKTARFQLMASYSDGKNKDITRTADYQVVNADGTPVTEITISNGTLKASKTAQKGSYTLIANYQDKQVQSTIEVSPVLTKIYADPDRVIMNPGKSQELNLIAEYSDYSLENITDKVTYKSSNVKRAEVNEKGVITIPETASSGTVTITAKYGSRTIYIRVTISK